MDNSHELEINVLLQKLSYELNVLGFTKVQYNVDGNILLKRLIKVAWDLVGSLKTKNLKINEYNESIMRLSASNKNLESNIKQLEKTISDKVELAEKHQCTITKVLKERDSFEKDCKHLKQELTKLGGTLETQRLQYENDFRKQEKRLEALQSALFKLSESKAKADIVNHMKTPNECQPDEPKKLHELVANKCLAHLDSNLQILLTENAALRGTLLKLFSGAVNLSHSVLKGERGIVSNDSETQSHHLFVLPYEELLEKVEEECIKVFTKITESVT